MWHCILALKEVKVGIICADIPYAIRDVRSRSHSTFFALLRKDTTIFPISEFFVANCNFEKNGVWRQVNLFFSLALHQL